MHRKRLQAIALRVVYHMKGKLGSLHGSPMRTLVMLVTGMIAVEGPWLSAIAREMAELPGSLKNKVGRLSRFLRRSKFAVEEAFAEVARGIVERYAHIYPKRMIEVALDWTDLGDFMGLWLSLPYQGRALPLWCKIVPKDLAKGSMTVTETELIEAFLGSFPEEVCRRIVILADRGFAKKELFEVIDKYKAPWVIRLERNRHLQVQGEWKTLESLGLEYGQEGVLRDVLYTKEEPVKIHVAMRRLREGEANDPDDDTWYLATRLEDAQTALFRYERRFCIEEMFRDLKDRWHIDRHWLETEEGLEKMMLVATLAYHVVIQEGNQKLPRLDRTRIEREKGRGKLSIFSLARWAFNLLLEEVPEEVGGGILSRFVNRRAG